MRPAHPSRTGPRGATRAARAARATTPCGASVWLVASSFARLTSVIGTRSSPASSTMSPTMSARSTSADSTISKVRAPAGEQQLTHRLATLDLGAAQAALLARHPDGAPIRRRPTDVTSRGPPPTAGHDLPPAPSARPSGRRPWAHHPWRHRPWERRDLRPAAVPRVGLQLVLLDRSRSISVRLDERGCQTGDALGSAQPTDLLGTPTLDRHRCADHVAQTPTASPPCAAPACGRSAITEQSTFTAAQPASRTRRTHSASSTMLSAPRQRSSVSGNRVPMSSRPGGAEQRLGHGVGDHVGVGVTLAGRSRPR